MKINIKMESDYKTYIEKYGLNVTMDQYRTLLRTCNPLAMKHRLENYLKEYYFDTEVMVLEDKLRIKVKDRGECAIGLITPHYYTFPMLYTVSTRDAVRLLTHIWYSFKGGFEIACYSAYWDFPEKFEGNKLLGFDNSNNGYSQAYLRADIKKVIFANKGYGKIKYLESLEQLHNISKLYESVDLFDFFEEIDSEWASSLQEESYTTDSIINTQVCLRPFIEVDVYS